MSDDRTKADKAWEARQEAARYRIFNAATNAAEATDEADDEKYFASFSPNFVFGSGFITHDTAFVLNVLFAFALCKIILNPDAEYPNSPDTRIKSPALAPFLSGI